MRLIQILPTENNHIGLYSSKDIEPLLKPGFHVVFEGLYGSLGLLSVYQSFTIAEGLLGSLE